MREGLTRFAAFRAVRASGGKDPDKDPKGFGKPLGSRGADNGLVKAVGVAVGV
jgi:hypothetical protein